MENNKYFLHEIKETNGVIEKGIVVKEQKSDAIQGYHAYLGAYAYGNNKDTTFVSCMITDKSGCIILPYNETWNASAET